MATLKSTDSPVLKKRAEGATPARQTTDAELLQCLVVSSSEDRRRMIRSAAEAQAWDAIVCCDAGEFLRWVFRRRVALMVVDLSPCETAEYGELRRAAEDAGRLSEALVLVSGTGALDDEEVWARSLGVWSYLPNADCAYGFEHLLREAQGAIARKEHLQRTW